MTSGSQLLVRAYGARAVLIELPDAATRRGVTHWLTRHGEPSVDVIPAETTVLLDVPDLRIGVADAQRQLRRLVRSLRSAEPDELTAPPTSGELHTIEVTYDGPDLDAVAAALDRSASGFIQWHTGTPWDVAFLGFMPGFGYLVREDHQLSIDRLASPRPAIPCGSVGFAGHYSGIYPRQSPGGWQLVGHTEHTLFDPKHGSALSAGDRVQFRAQP